jgi:hypothetical protein
MAVPRYNRRDIRRAAEMDKSDFYLRVDHFDPSGDDFHDRNQKISSICPSPSGRNNIHSHLPGVSLYLQQFLLGAIDFSSIGITHRATCARRAPELAPQASMDIVDDCNCVAGPSCRVSDRHKECDTTTLLLMRNRTPVTSGKAHQRMRQSAFANRNSSAGHPAPAARKVWRRCSPTRRRRGST